MRSRIRIEFVAADKCEFIAVPPGTAWCRRSRLPIQVDTRVEPDHPPIGPGGAESAVNSVTMNPSYVGFADPVSPNGSQPPPISVPTLHPNHFRGVTRRPLRQPIKSPARSGLVSSTTGPAHCPHAVLAKVGARGFPGGAADMPAVMGSRPRCRSAVFPRSGSDRRRGEVAVALGS